MRHPTIMFRQLAASREPAAIELSRILEEGIAYRLLLDSPVQRIARRILDSSQFRLWLDRTVPQLDSTFDPSASIRNVARRKRKAVIRIVAETSSKSGAVFSDAVDVLERTLPVSDSRTSYFDPRSFINERVVRSLLTSHAFDAGDERSLNDIKQQRERLIWLASRRVPLLARESIMPLETFDSRTSVYGQAADVAARFAASQFEKQGLVAVTRRFTYVVYNGGRVDKDTAAETMRKWGELK